ncbi:uncharacterized protein YukE [Clostridium tetanomorphum]|uniref:Proteins of 100 residues with WXG n=1 Tax=Clostridium tetanomorphum TaxID=1553 RepID=A0A923E549_CLOTT|nr:WXG100 family type VII secretion target [Clostridium tetanomorphum]KAJ49494.1 hypothetical protein CTM_22861 [Clostridium tetanomorphum DSM 665]KAJ51429.1 hypothetical protein CTM_12595 [Clostridium tetanomorphum DSM 665]MBC2396523.1 hypothetical protein [Clostridium tetanomorphum]MBP1863848.1 uncharacterized protein YukE [Clostridium tetanomorphum]NRS84926.1 uncharacterized protein YukE [Clostridium tetanomorphum]
MGFWKDDTIKFDYDSVQKAYTIMHQIYEDADKLLEQLEKDSKDAEDKMKGEYREAYSDKSEDVFKELKKSIKNIDKLSKKVEQTSKDFLEKDMEIAKSYRKS